MTTVSGQTDQRLPSQVFQINLQANFGGGEIYTRFFSNALLELGISATLFVSPRARYWDQLGLKGVRIVPVGDEKEIEAALGDPGKFVVTHTLGNPEFSARLAQRHILSGFAHMPWFQRDPSRFGAYHRIFAVSRHVLDSLGSHGLNVYPHPLYGVADLQPRSIADPVENGTRIVASSIYDWDRRKLRDRLLGLMEPIAQTLRKKREFVRRPGLTLGIVSRLTPIKQFPLLFQHLSPILQSFPKVNLEIFGSGGYASVRDLKASLTPIQNNVRFWGHQPDPAAIYPMLDFVLSGLPEREALGLNLIEAQYCGTPVLAVDAPPFTETVADGVSGYLYCDPRKDNGAGFAALLRRLLTEQSFPRPNLADAHLAQFSREAFRQRVAEALAATWNQPRTRMQESV